MKSISNYILKKVILTFTLLFLPTNTILFCQPTEYQWYYRVYFSDKGDNSTQKYMPEELLSERAIWRREKAGIAFPDIKDIPVCDDYLNTITLMGYKLHTTSRWMNTALFKSLLPGDINQLLDLPFVRNVKIVKTSTGKGLNNNKLEIAEELDGFPAYDRPIEMLNGNSLHDMGYKGQNILIAVLDGGFTDADKIESTEDVRIRYGIKSTFDFVNNSDYVYSYSTHGTAVFSVLAGNLPGRLTGTAPDAEYILLRTEDVATEFPCEEDFWVAGAEYADSTGADIITTSLGYSVFDDPDLNYRLPELDGNSAFITKAADIAASKGILVVTSAGNEGNKAWEKIIFPADGDSVLAVGAVSEDNIIAYFSSKGPSADNRIKPDIVSMGIGVAVQTSINSVIRANGTSFSCPVISGMAASLLQAVPEATNMDIINALKISADRFTTPDSLYGYGLPEMTIALAILQEKYITKPSGESMAAPNPTTGDLEIIFKQVPGSVIYEIISWDGRLVFRKEILEFTGRVLFINELKNKTEGIYFIRVIKNDGVVVHKIIKLNI